ncbi:MAG TPA: hypothetical protein DCE56_38500, partial [Cyanobacteria bacterium UBA8553]|nr:hypothetical protein [Cyanobacteria bacterium UBA8553]HAJ61360.1 hypothetical protein [Cyanobacteria bacterium UBA8543]
MNSSRTQNPEHLPEQLQTAVHKSKVVLPSAPLPDPLGQNIEAVIALQAKAEKDLSRTQRIVEATTAFFGRPIFLFCILIGVSVWIVPNVLPERFGFPKFDPPPFEWLEHLLSLASLLMSTGILITQNRQEKLAEQRMQLSLQLNLLSEQKIAKLIALFEELRRDLPNVKDRHDPEAEVMKQPADPHVVIEVLEKSLTEELEQLQQQESTGGMRDEG